ncbi:hypothetical protein DH2020_023898 [Rehmannia glutinosa]|uniref:RING-type E3 ubiquitin transferase n=1 Tax=Rehmannia glutinosa TaxID=99300 RepID=A0ABR0WBQ4_REHGL
MEIFATAQKFFPTADVSFSVRAYIMQVQRPERDPFSETTDSNQVSFPGNASIDRSIYWDMLENRLSDMLALDDENISYTNAANNRAQSNIGWDCGESSSTGNNPQQQVTNQMTGSSNRGSLNLNSNQGRVTENNRRIDLEACLPHNMCKSGSSSNYSETNNASGSSLSVSSGPPNPSLTSHVGPLNPSEVEIIRLALGLVQVPVVSRLRSSRPDISRSSKVVRNSSLVSFTRIESDSGNQRRSPLYFCRSVHRASYETATTGRGQRQSDQRPAAFRWICQDYMLIDPLLNVFAELHDRDIRLNIDDMSYEQLLELEERIGNVSRGLSKEKIRGSMKQREYEGTHASPDLESCCICQEDYVAGDYIGKLGCGHEFHTSCIERWLILKNVCPVCKMTAVETS